MNDTALKSDQLNQSTINWLLLVLFGICWGLTIPLSKVATSTGHQPIGLIFWQLVITILILVIPTLLRKLPMPTTPRHLAYYFGIAMLGTLVPGTFSFWSYAYLPAGIVAIVIAMVPMFALIIALLLGQEIFRYQRLMGIMLGVVALMLIALPKASLPENVGVALLLLPLVTAIAYGAEGSYISRFDTGDTNPITSLLAASILGVFVAAPIALLRGDFVDLTGAWGKAEIALICGSALHGVTYAGFIWLVRRAGPVFSSQIAYIVTLTAVFVSWLFLNETYAWTIWFALFLMVAGLWLVQPGTVSDMEALLDE